MANTFHLEIITPTDVYHEGQVSYLRAPGADGLLGVMAGHTKAMVALLTGEIKVIVDSKEKFYATSGGFAQIDGDTVKLLVETAELSDSIDLIRAQEALDKAHADLEKHKLQIEEKEKLLRAQERAVNRLQIARKRS